MKKNYLIPSIKVVRLQAKHGILVGSETIQSVSGNTELSFGGGSSETARTRESNVWDSEW